MWDELITPLFVSCPEDGNMSTITLQPSSPLSILPAAAPSIGPDPCNFTDRNSLLARVESDWQGYNLSLLVQNCSGVCPLVYGSGNPDISGPGVNATVMVRTSPC